MCLNRTSDSARIVLFAILFIFFLQVLSDFIQSIYAFGLLVTAFTIQLASVLLLFTPLALISAHRAPSRPWIIGLACIAMLGRLLEPVLDPGGRLVACGISVGAFMLLFPSMLAVARPPMSVSGWRLACGLLIAVVLSIFFRTVNSSLDVSEYGIYQVVAWVLAALAGRLIWDWEVSAARSQDGAQAPPTRLAPSSEAETPASYEDRREQSLRSLEASSRSAREQEIDSVASLPRKDAPAATPRVLALCIGLAFVMILLYFAFASPTVIARWTGYSYAAIVTVQVLTLTVFAFVFSSRVVAGWLSRPVVLTWNGLFVLTLMLTIIPHQIAFPATPNGYPLDATAASAMAVLPLFLSLVLSPVIFIDFMLYVRQLSAEGPSIRQLGGGFAVASLFLLVMVFLHVFTTIYDYAAPIGPLFRDRFWLVYLLAGLGLGLPMLLVPAWVRDEAPVPRRQEFTTQIVGLLALLSIGAVYLTSPRPPEVPETTDGLRVMTYNIQQGFDRIGGADLPGQLRAMERVSPDVLGLEESDTARVANGNVDAVRYFADKLDMYSYYGPTTTTGTFGIALLSKYPILSPRTFFMYSIGEQTAAIEAQISVNGKTYNIFVTHLGNDGPMVQLQDVLKRVGGLPNVILMGDFNFDPSTAQYALARQTLADAWLVRWPGGHKLYPFGAEGRIDLIFVTPGMQVMDSDYVSDGSSDHPYLYAVIKP